MKQIVYNEYVCKGGCVASEDIDMPCNCKIPRYANEEKDIPTRCLYIKAREAEWEEVE